MRKDVFGKGMVLGIIILFVGAGVVPSISGESWQTKTTYGETPRALSVNVGTIIVDDEGDGDYTCIQDAIDNAHDGDIIEVYSGTYVENVVVDKQQLTLTGIDFELGSGADIGKPIIDGDEKESVVYISSDNIELNGFDIRNSGKRVAGPTSADAGVEVHSNNNLICGNDFSYNLDNLGLYSSDTNTLYGNNFSYCDWDGIFLYKSNENNIYNNTFYKSGIGPSDSYENIFLNNTVNGKPLIYLEGISNRAIEEDAGQIVLVSCQNITIQNQEITNTSHGIYMGNCINCIIKNCELSYNNANGILLTVSSGNVIQHNNISNNNYLGIDLFPSSSNNNISGNNIINNSYGVLIRDSTCINNAIWSNNFLGNKIYNALDKSGLDNNKWDNGTVGNYWSNQWYAKDLNGDFISEIPCYIPLTGIDWYPLMNPVGMDVPDPVSIELEIEIPKEGYLHIGNKVIRETSSGKTIIFALPWMDPLTINVRASGKYGVEAVRAYIDFDENKSWDNIKLQHQVGSNLYKGNFDRNIIGTHNLTIVAYDKWHNDGMVSMQVSFFYIPRPTIID